MNTILITGSSSGFGLETARYFLDRGWRVIATMREPRRAVLPESERLRIVALDVTDAASIARALDEAGPIDALVNNAGIFPRSTIDTDVLSQFDPVFHVNVRAPLMLSQALIHHCRKQRKPGTIVNIGSINAYCGADMILIYSMSKGAMMTMTRNIADTHGCEGIRANQLNVGWTLTQGEIETQRKMGSPDDWHTKIDKSGAPRGSLLMPEEVAEHAIFWLSDKSAPVNGSVYEVEQYPVIGRNRAAGK